MLERGRERKGELERNGEREGDRFYSILRINRMRFLYYTVHKKKRIFLMLQLVTNCLTDTPHIA